MAETDRPTQRARALRKQLLLLAEELQQESLACGLPTPPPAFLAALELLKQESYRVAVMGETKRGMSSFINALLGRSLLPTDVDIATCQVFQVSHSSQERCRLRFQDGSAQEIRPEELNAYGSQQVQDLGGAPRLEQVLRCIEVEVPFHFPVPGVVLLDTPGLGGLYPANTFLAERALWRADAVIFVLDSNQPVSQPELAFVEEILQVTRNVFFIQTKIDLHGWEKWHQVQSRNQEALKARFGDQLHDTRVWPISSRHLQRARETGEELDLLISRQPALADALELFLWRAVGSRRAAPSLVAALDYWSEARLVLRDRGLLDRPESRAELLETLAGLSEQLKRFKSQWGASGRSRAAQRGAAARINRLVRVSLEQALKPGGQVEALLLGEIEALADAGAARALAEQLPYRCASAAHQACLELGRQARIRILEQWAEFDHAGSEVLGKREDRDGWLICWDEWWIQVRREAKHASGAAQIDGAVPSLVSELAPFFAALTRPGARSGPPEPPPIKTMLRQNVEALLRQARNDLLGGEGAGEGRGPVEEYCRALGAALEQETEKTYRRVVQAAAREIAFLQQGHSPSTALSRPPQAAQEPWDALGRTIQQCKRTLKELAT